MCGFADSSLLVPGTVVRGTYTIESVLGRGAFGVVYQVWHRFLGRQAMKVLDSEGIAERAEDLLQEARILATLVDPHVVRVFEANILDDHQRPWPYLTMELVPGGTLAAYLEQRVRLPVLHALTVAGQICAGLSAGHRLSPPIVHRDVTPRNVLIAGGSAQGTPQVKIGDFGLAKYVDPDSLMARAAGTVRYLAPEAVWGVHTPASDAYAVGVVLFQMLTGVHPFPVPETIETNEPPLTWKATLAERNAPILPPSKFRLGLSASIDALVQRALAPDARNRYSSAMELGADLDRVITQLP